MNPTNDANEAGAIPPTISGDEFIEQFEERLRSAGLVEMLQVDLSATHHGVVSLDLLKVLDKANLRKGLAAHALQLLLQLADEFGTSLEVIPRNIGGPLSDEVLDAWYRRHGFESEASVDPPQPMRRAPRSPTET